MNAHGTMGQEHNSLERWHLAQGAELEFWKADSGFRKRAAGNRQLLGDLMKRVELHYGLHESSMILDVGCGPSPVALLVTRGKKFGIDPLIQKYRNLGELPLEVKFIESVAEHLPLPPSVFDMVICRDVLDHTANPKAAVDEILRVLKKDGVLILSVNIHTPFIAWLKRKVELWNLPLREKFHAHFFTQGEVDDLVNNHFSRRSAYAIRPGILTLDSSTPKRFVWSAFWFLAGIIDRYVFMNPDQRREYTLVLSSHGAA